MRHLAKTGGYTLTELLVAMALVGLVAGAVLGLYQVSQDIYIRASSLEAAQTGGRAGLHRMANELRLIGSFWVGATGAGNAITAATTNSITFLADVDADTLNNAGDEITLTAQAVSGSTSISVNRTTGSVGGNAFSPGEWVYIANGATREVKQISENYRTGLSIRLTAPLTSTITNTPQPAIVRSVETITYYLKGTDLRRNHDGIVENVNGLTLSYFGGDGTLLGSPPNLTQIREIQIDLTVQGATDGSKRFMTTRVKPRSLP